MKVGDLVRFRWPEIKFKDTVIACDMESDYNYIGVVLRVGTYRRGNDFCHANINYPEGAPLYEVLWLTKKPLKVGYTHSGIPPENMSYEQPDNLEVVIE